MLDDLEERRLLLLLLLLLTFSEEGEEGMPCGGSGWLGLVTRTLLSPHDAVLSPDDTTEARTRNPLASPIR